jgi:hypothetical protein
LGFSSIETFNSNLAVKKMPTYIISKWQCLNSSTT